MSWAVRCRTRTGKLIHATDEFRVNRTTGGTLTTDARTMCSGGREVGVFLSAAAYDEGVWEASSEPLNCRQCIAAIRRRQAHLHRLLIGISD